jgi:Methane oxygenase PmoA/Domain of unknown function (DUF4440)
MKLCVLFFSAICLVSWAGLCAIGQEDPTAAVKAADDARVAAMKSPSRELLGEVFSDDLRYAHSTGTIDTKASFIDVLVGGKTKYLAYDYAERNFTFPAKGIALMSGRARVQAESANGKMDNTLSFLAVWREEQGKWRFLAWQSCRIPQVESNFELKKHAEGVQVLRDGKLFADYLTKSFSKPIVWPLIGPTGARMTRDYPMVSDSKDEAHDHPHHRSLWFTHGEVNGVDFWLEGEGKGGVTEHLEFTELQGGKTAVIATRNNWNSPKGDRVLTDSRRFTFSSDSTANWVDCEVLLTATEGDVHFGDTKEGTFGVRVAESMKVDAKKGGKIINSAGLTDSAAWGKPAEWVDYYGPVGSETLGIAILCHPTTFNFPNRWHVRTYGLFAANPFGVYHFTGATKATDGVHLKKGEKLLFRYRVVMHSGDEKTGNIAGRYAEFSKLEFKALD